MRPLHWPLLSYHSIIKKETNWRLVIWFQVFFVGEGQIFLLYLPVPGQWRGPPGAGSRRRGRTRQGPRSPSQGSCSSPENSSGVNNPSMPNFASHFLFLYPFLIFSPLIFFSLLCSLFNAEQYVMQHPWNSWRSTHIFHFIVYPLPLFFNSLKVPYKAKAEWIRIKKI